MNTLSIHPPNVNVHQTPNDVDGGILPKVKGNDDSHSLLLDTLQLTSELLSKRAERKLITKAQVECLMHLDSPLREQYERTYICGEHVYHKQHTVTGEQKVFTGYCNKRWCTVCASHKTAEMMNGYLEPLKELPDLHFVTLTVVSVIGDELKDRMKSMQSTFVQIKDSMRKKGLKLSGVRKLESNHNPIENTYNPHYHLILSGRIESLTLVDEWLTRNPDCSIKAQNIQVADDDSFKELFKYTVKSLVDNEFHPEAQDTIYRAMFGVRAFQSFGDVKKSSVTNDNHSDDTDLAIEDVDDSQTGEWVTLGVYTWISHERNWLNYRNEPLRYVSIRPKIETMLSQFRE
jgi:plasmid rolling circle replication initiator protein Rep